MLLNYRSRHRTVAAPQPEDEPCARGPATPIYIEPVPAPEPPAEREVDPNDPATWSYFAHAFWYQADRDSWRALADMARATGQTDVVQGMVRDAFRGQ